MLCGCGAARVERDLDGKPSRPLLVARLSALQPYLRSASFLELKELDEILSDKIGREYMISFAKANLCEESVSCALRLRDLQRLDDDKSSLDAARGFADEYLGGASRKLTRHFVEDIPERLRRSLVNALDESKNNTLCPRAKSLLYQTHSAVEKFIRADIFLRFRESKHYKELLAVHPRRTLRIPAVFEAFAAKLSEEERLTLRFLVEADSLVDLQATLDRHASELLSQRNVAVSYISEWGESSSASSSSLDEQRRAALDQIADAYLAFLLTEEGLALTRTLTGASDSCRRLVEEGNDKKATAAGVSVDVGDDDDDYAKGW